MATSYINEVLDEVFQRGVALEKRQNSETANIHHAIITTDFVEAAYRAGLDEFNVAYTKKDLENISKEFMDRLKPALKARRIRTTKTPLGGGGIIASSSPRKAKTRKSDVSLEDIKAAVRSAKAAVRPRLNKLVGDRQKAGKIQGKLQYAHGEGGGPISTIGTEAGLEVIDIINSPQGSKKLDQYIKDGNLFFEKFNTSLRDYYKVQLGWDVIRIDPKNGNIAKVDDKYEITGAFKAQDPSFASRYDMAYRDPLDGRIYQSFKNTLATQLQKALMAASTAGALNPSSLSGSPTPVERAQFATAKQVINQIEKALRKADMRGVVTVETAVKKIKKTKTKDKGKRRTIKEKEIGIQNKSKDSKAKSRKSRAQPAKNRDVSPIALKSLLQKALPDAIARKMTGPPTLTYRTGRFAQSAEITNIAPMQKQVEIQYDYLQNPYRVFEPGSGNPLASTKRDPRQLIGGTIRELAQQIMGNKFLIRTKRV